MNKPGSTNTRNAKRKQRRLSRKKRSGGAGFETGAGFEPEFYTGIEAGTGAGTGAGAGAVAGEFVKRYITDPYNFVSEKLTPFNYISRAVDTTRSASSLIRNINQAYRFYIHCRDSVLRQIPEGDSKKIFTDAVNDLGDLLNSIFNCSFLSKHTAVLRGAVVRSESIKSDLRIFEENLKRYRINAPNSSLPSKIYNKTVTGASILIWGDWYRYELNILMTNLLALIEEMSVRRRLVPDIVNNNGVVAVPSIRRKQKFE